MRIIKRNQEKNKKENCKKILKRIKKEIKGITLIALVVTVIVLLVLAGVAINLTVGDNGLFKRAQNAADTYEQASEKEKIELAISSTFLDKTGDFSITKSKLENALRGEFGNDTEISVKENGDGSFLVSMNDTQRMYYIDETGEIIDQSKILKISTADELRAFRDDVNSGNTYEGWYVYLANDITLDINEEWEPIGLYPNDSPTPDNTNNKPFTAIFDGHNHEIDGIYINTTNKVQGLFGLVNNGKILNLGIGNNCNIIGGNSTGAIVGYLYTGIIYNCHNNSIVTGNNTLGGIVGQIYNGTIENSYNLAKISGNKTIGGIVGGLYNNSNMKRCYNNGNVLGKENVGGISGIIHTNTNVEECYNTGNINGNECSGGIVGYISTSVLKKCYNTGEIMCDELTGGIAGINEAEISLCYNIGEIKGTVGIGGLAGQNNNLTGIIKNSYSLESKCDNLIGESLNYSKIELCEIKTEQELKALVSTLGESFKEDTNNINNGYPILSWQ